ncbi:hypothetical protein [Lentzea indica]|uniref:hypothetical protein n=1 Tax=Lentzea indica TaxID=2604800 RepID=UPI00143B9B1D|nr:hypothetical protein [Lentzea indica]
MIRLRSGAMAGAALSLLLVAAPAALAEPEAASVELAVRDGALLVTPPEKPLTVLAGEPVRVRLDTKAIPPGTLFGDVVRVRTTGTGPTTVPVSGARPRNGRSPPGERTPSSWMPRHTCSTAHRCKRSGTRRWKSKPRNNNQRR